MRKQIQAIVDVQLNINCIKHSIYEMINKCSIFQNKKEGNNSV